MKKHRIMTLAAVLASAVILFPSCGSAESDPPAPAHPANEPSATDAAAEAPEVTEPEPETLPLLPVDPETVAQTETTEGTPEIPGDPFDETALISYTAELAHFFPQPLESPDHLNRGRSFAFYLLRQTYLDTLAAGVSYRTDGDLIFIPGDELIETAKRRLGVDPDLSAIFEWPFGEPENGEYPYDITAELPAVGIDGVSASIDESAGAAAVSVTIYDIGADSPEHNTLIYRFVISSGVWRLTGIDEG